MMIGPQIYSPEFFETLHGLQNTAGHNITFKKFNSFDACEKGS